MNDITRRTKLYLLLFLLVHIVFWGAYFLNINGYIDKELGSIFSLAHYTILIADTIMCALLFGLFVGVLIPSVFNGVNNRTNNVEKK